MQSREQSTSGDPRSAECGIWERFCLRSIGCGAGSGEMRRKVVNEVLENEDKRRDLPKTLEAYGILQRCVRI